MFLDYLWIGYVPVDARYPARRRAQRLSYAVWPVLANYWGSLELQPALEEESTSDRLRQEGFPRGGRARTRRPSVRFKL